MEAVVVLLKVGLALGGWLLVFLMTFLGYITLPAIVLFAFLVLYSVTDVAGRRLRRKRKQL
ncbi:MAG TPA: hypothetical protein VF157_00230 [Chloroflexota bacterium]